MPRLNGYSGFSNNLRISPTVSSNDLIVTIVTASGSTPSSSDPIMIRIGNTDRYITSALSVTKADGTNWANLGSAELGTKEQDLFVYAVWNTNLTPDAVDIFWSRIPYGRLYSDFSATTTNEKYAAINSTAPASTDECVLIGRFAATLSLSGTSHLWTVPTYTNINLVNHPIYETRDLTFTLTGSGFTIGNGTVTAIYKRRGTDVTGHLEFVLGSTSAISGDVTFVPPVTQGTYGVANEPVGINRLVAAGSGYGGVVIAASTTSFRVAVYIASGTYLTAGLLTSTIPGTWTTNDLIQFPFSYIGA